MKTSVKREIGGRELVIETGEIAKLCNCSVIVKYSDTIVLVSVTSQKTEEKEGFFPLTVEYREKISAVGKIPGGFYKREGRPTTKEILTMRLIDRPLRPLFPEWYQDEVQIIALVLSADQDNDPDIPALIGAAASLYLSDIPFETPIGSVRVGRLKNKFILNPTYKEIEEGDMNIVITGSEESIIMVEGSANEVPEKIVLEGIYWGYNHLKTIIDMQKELKEKIGEIEKPNYDKSLLDKITSLQNIIEEKYREEIAKALFIPTKKKRKKKIEEIFEKLKENLKSDEYSEDIIERSFEKVQRSIIRENIKKGKRVDGRGLKDIRPITCRVGLLPRTHGSALFTRGETQALVTVTLGKVMDGQIVEGLLPDLTKRFMVHYNFPPFCVGEVKSIRGPSRREIGHGALAEKALESVIPEEKRFPYTIRVVSDIMESNGSSSMATICGGTLALMDAGVPIKKPVGGIAMGLVIEDNEYYILSDIIGLEDHYGDMDFKVAGTQRGITALQMDIKVSKGITKELLKKIMEQAREGRIHILREMMLTLDRPRKEISNYAPRVIRMKVNIEKIANIIGPSGKNIKHIQEVSESTIEIEDDGTVTIYSTKKENAQKAKEMIEQIVEEVKVGKIYKGKVTSIKDFGAFVEIIPGLEGLVHVSELEKDYVQNVSDVVKVGDEILVKVLAIDDQNRIKLSKRAADKEISKKNKER